MLKRILVNNRVVPVPVPVLDLAQAIAWVESTLVPAGSFVTRIVLDNNVMEYGENGLSRAAGSQPLQAGSRLEFQVDSPSTLAAQTLDSIHSLAAAVLGTLKGLAVHSWQSRPAERLPELGILQEDVRLVVDLINHVHGLLGGLPGSDTIDPGPVAGIGRLLDQNLASFSLARSQSDWKACAKVMLNRFEPLLRDLLMESETLQIRTLALQPQLNLPATGSASCATMGDVTPIRRAGQNR
ncbi:MAG: hypothetical protein RIQ81_2138 [Pseudomonadota bacterium]|jgi:hypothetical protein